jgi:H+-transporting ATPase
MHACWTAIRSKLDQSALTGRVAARHRKPGEAVFSASIIRQGEIGALVYATGADTYFGKTAELVQEAQTVSHFQKAVLKIGTILNHPGGSYGDAVIICRLDHPR